jgi:hypothetical protein
MQRLGLAAKHGGVLVSLDRKIELSLNAGGQQHFRLPIP